MDPERSDDLKEMMKQWKSSMSDDGRSKGSQDSPKIEVNCTKYGMMFPPITTFYSTRRNTANTKQPRSPKLKTSATSHDEKIYTENVENFDTPTTSTVKPSGSSGKDVLGPLNVDSKDAKGARFKKPANVITTRVKRKRIVEDGSVSAENIPVESLRPGFEHGINKGLNLSPTKRMRLEGLFSNALTSRNKSDR